jgi:hypothetical protein
MRNDEEARQSLSDTDHLALRISDAAEVLLREIDREEALGHDPATSRLWLRAPMRRRRDYIDCRVDDREFWRGLRQWLEFERRARDAA